MLGVIVDITDAITEAIAGFLAEHGGGIVTSFACAAEYIDSDGDRCWITAHGEGQSPSQTLGLLRWHTINAETQCAEMMFEGDED